MLCKLFHSTDLLSVKTHLQHVVFIKIKWLLLSFYFQKRKENEIETATVDITGIHAVVKCIVRISLIYQSKQIC